MKINNISVIGAGFMGHGIAQLFAQAGKNVYVYDINDTSLEHAKSMIHNSLTVMVEKDIVTQHELEAAESQLVYTTDMNTALKDADLVVEVVPEILDLKWETYEKVERIVSEKTIIASNTSAIPLTQLTEKAKHPERFIITHFFGPSQIVPLVEIIKTDSTYQEIIDSISN